MSHCRFCGCGGVRVDEDGICEQCVSEAMHRDNDPHPPIPGIDNFDDLCDGYDDDPWDEDEPTGSCERCDSNVYDGGDLCDQCEWLAFQAGSPPGPRRRADGRLEDPGQEMTA